MYRDNKINQLNEEIKIKENEILEQQQKINLLQQKIDQNANEPTQSDLHQQQQLKIENLYQQVKNLTSENNEKKQTIMYRNNRINQLNKEIKIKENEILEQQQKINLLQQKIGQNANEPTQSNSFYQQQQIQNLYQQINQLTYENKEKTQKIMSQDSKILEQQAKIDLLQKTDNKNEQDIRQKDDQIQQLNEVSQTNEVQQQEIENLKKKIKELNKEINDKNEKIAQKDKEIEDKNKELDSQRQNLTTKDYKIKKLKGKKSSLKEIVSTNDNLPSSLQMENETLKDSVSELQEKFLQLNELNSGLNNEKEELKNQINKLNDIITEKDIKIKELIEEINKKESLLSSHKFEQKKEQKKSLQIYTTKDIESLVGKKQIGRGATSDVFEVFRQEKIAMKVLNTEMNKPDKSDDDDDDDDEKEELEISIGQLKNLMKEYEVLNALDHPNIVKTFGIFFGDSTHKPAIFLEYCESNLKKRIKKLSDDKQISAIFSLSSAMKKVHEVGIIHRDLKPENILVDSNDNVKLSDFGLCTLIKNDDETMNHTAMAGSWRFMSPELLNGRTDYDEKVDVYAFGVVVFFILAKGQYPKISMGEVSNGKQAEIPSNISKFSTQLIKDCLSFKSSDRPSFAEICDRLKGNEQNLI